MFNINFKNHYKVVHVNNELGNCIIGGAVIGIAASALIEAGTNIKIDGKPIKEWISSGISTGISAIGNAVVDGASAAWDWTKSTSTSIKNKITSSASTATNWTKEKAKAAWNYVDNKTSETLDWIANSGSSFASWVTSW